MAEKQTADECMRSLENRNEALIKETERLRARLRILEDSHEDMAQREQDLAHQQHTLELSVDDASKGTHCYWCVCATGISSLLAGVPYNNLVALSFFMLSLFLVQLFQSSYLSLYSSVIGSRPSDHYFRSVCLFVCLCRVFFSRLRSDLDQTRTHVTCPGLVVSPRI